MVELVQGNKKDNMVKFIISILAGIVTFWIWYGFMPLNVLRDDWLMYGYAESDNMQHYAGWLAFRNSEWSFPLGKITTIAYPMGTQISFMDSIPWLAILFKIFDQFLPTTFQYFGVYVLLCFILQFYAALLIFSLYSDGLLPNCLKAGFFLFAPIIIERAFRHTSLSSHWLILFSIYLFLRAKKYGHTKFEFLYVLLIILSIGIHPYFLPMIFGIMVADALDAIVYEKKYLLSGQIMLISGIGIVVTSYILGIFRGGSSVNLSQGYGVFSANLNCFFNPISTNVMSTGCNNRMYRWSSALPSLPQINGNYDGFNYLGIGGLIILASIIVWLIVYGFKRRKEFVLLIKKYIFFLGALVVFALYAITNVVTLNDRMLEIPLPQWLSSICGIFGASGRMMYPVYYMVLIFGLGYVFDKCIRGGG